MARGHGAASRETQPGSIIKVLAVASRIGVLELITSVTVRVEQGKRAEGFQLEPGSRERVMRVLEPLSFGIVLAGLAFSIRPGIANPDDEVPFVRGDPNED